VRDAGVVITCTFAKDPVFDDAWLGAHAHVNAAGSNQATRREIAAGNSSTRRAHRRRFPRTGPNRSGRPAARREAAEASGRKCRSTELGALLTQPDFARPDGVTLFKSLGLGVQDIAVAALVYERAR
jgi:ornithine cyclodeaminase